MSYEPLYKANHQCLSLLTTKKRLLDITAVSVDQTPTVSKPPPSLDDAVTLPPNHNVRSTYVVQHDGLCSLTIRNLRDMADHQAFPPEAFADDVDDLDVDFDDDDDDIFLDDDDDLLDDDDLDDEDDDEV